MKQILIVFLIATLVSCVAQYEPVTPVLEIYGIDMSMSMRNGFALPDTSYMRKVITTHIRAKEDYTIACYRIGVASDKMLLIASFPVSPPVNLAVAPSIRDKRQKQNDSIDNNNQLRISSYLRTLQRDVFDAGVNSPRSNINEFSAKASLLLQEPGFRSPNSLVHVILISDGIQDSKQSKSDTLLNPFSCIPNVTLYLIGCKYPEAFRGAKTEQFESIESMLLFLQKPIVITTKTEKQ